MLHELVEKNPASSAAVEVQAARPGHGFGSDTAWVIVEEISHIGLRRLADEEPEPAASIEPFLVELTALAAEGVWVVSTHCGRDGPKVSGEDGLAVVMVRKS